MGESAHAAWGQWKGMRKSNVCFWVARPMVFSAWSLCFASTLCRIAWLDQKSQWKDIFTQLLNHATFFYHENFTKHTRGIRGLRHETEFSLNHLADSIIHRQQNDSICSSPWSPQNLEILVCAFWSSSSNQKGQEMSDWMCFLSALLCSCVKFCFPAIIALEKETMIPQTQGKPALTCYPRLSDFLLSWPGSSNGPTEKLWGKRRPAVTLQRLFWICHRTWL